MLRRPRRNRKSPVIRDMVRETWLAPQHLIFPLFLENGKNIKKHKEKKNKTREYDDIQSLLKRI